MLKEPTHNNLYNSGVYADIMLLFMNQGHRFSHEQETNIQHYITQNKDEDKHLLILKLYQENLIPKKLLIKLIMTNSELANNNQINHWWQQQKHIIRSRKNQQHTAKKAQSNKDNIDYLLNNPINEKQLVAELKQSIAQFAKSNFYTYRSGNNYYYSVKPDEETMGTRCDQNGNPLRDEMNNELTTRQGDFRFVIQELIEIHAGEYTSINHEVPNGTEGATPLADMQGVALSTKYRDIIKKDKPKNPLDQKKAEAINYLVQKIDIVSADEIYHFISTPYFQELIGANEHLSSIKSILKTTLVKICRKFTTDYEQHILNTNSDEIILNNLLDKKKYFQITSDKLATLFWRYDPILIADIVVNLYEDKEFTHSDLNYDFLARLLNGELDIIERLNEKRCIDKTKLLLPPDSRLPGADNLEQGQLTKYQLFQWDAETVAAAEGWLRNNFANIIVNGNSVINTLELDKASPVFFYQIPANSYMLLDPNKKNDPNFHRYQQLREHLQSLVADRNQVHGIPLIFFGIINIFNTHYIPYFIYRNDQGIVDVIVIDSSPFMYPPSVRSKQFMDTKLETNLKLDTIFNDLFPDCRFHDPMVTQMLRERDCGPNSAQTLYDALATISTATPLIFIDQEEQRLKINPQILTLKGKPNGVNPYTKTYTYPLSIEINSNNNRSTWQQRLSQVSMITYYARTDMFKNRPMTVNEPFYGVPEEYSYVTQVESQILYDERNSNISAIQSLLLSNEEGRQIVADIINEYKRTLKWVQFERLAEFIRSKADDQLLTQYTSAHSDLQSLIDDFVTVILRDHIPEALQLTLQKTILDRLPERTDLDANDIVSQFLTQHQAVFIKLTPHEQATITRLLKEKASLAVRQKLTDLHMKVIGDLLQRNCDFYLSTLPVIQNFTDSLETLFLIQLNQEPVSHYFKDKDNKYRPETIEQSLRYLKENAYPQLKALCLQHIQTASHLVIETTLRYAKTKLDLTGLGLQGLLKFFDPMTKNYLPLAPSTYLPSSHPVRLKNVLTVEDQNSALGILLIPQIGEAVFQEIKTIFASCVREQVSRFIARSDFIADYTGSPLNVIDSRLNNDNTLNLHFDFTDIIREQGKPSTLTLEIYQHAIASSFIQKELILAIQEAYVETRQQKFVSFANMIMQYNHPQLIFDNINEHFDLTGNLTFQLFATSIQKNANFFELFYSTFYTWNNKTKLYNQNQCGARFYAFFNKQYAQQIQDNYAKALQLKQHVETVIITLKDLQFQGHPQINLIVDGYLKELNQLIVDLSHCHLDQEFEAKLHEFEQRYKTISHTHIVELAKLNYLAGDMVPGSITTLLRPTLCTLLNVTTPFILTELSAEKIDNSIRTKLKNLIHDPLNYCIIKSSLPILEKTLTLPDTYNKNLTPQLISSMVAYWYTNRTTLTNARFILEKDYLPPLIQQLIVVANNCFALEQASLNDDQIQSIRTVLPLDPKAQLKALNDSDLLAKIISAVILTKDIVGYVMKPTNLSFEQISKLLQGQMVQSITCKKVSKKNITQQKFNDLVRNEYDKRVAEAHKNLKDGEQPEQILFDDVIRDLSPDFIIEGKPVRKLIKLADFNRILNKTVLAETHNANVVEQATGTRPAVDINKIRKKLLEHEYEIENSDPADENQGHRYVPSAQLQRPIFKLFNRNTTLSKLLRSLKARHQGPEKSELDDRMDNYDLNQIVLLLKSRWQRICSKESIQSAVKHYLSKTPYYKDSEYIAMAFILSTYFRKQGQKVCAYDLLMPGTFTAADQLFSLDQPESIAKEIGNVGEDDRLYEIDGKRSLDIAPTVDDIPLPNLVITDTGYALDIHWTVRIYISNRKFTNPYTNESLTLSEIDQILEHPKASKLINAVTANCIAHLTPRAIDILEKYIKATVFRNGYTGNYSEAQNDLVSKAAQTFQDDLKTLPPLEKEALMKETIPNDQYSHTVKYMMDRSGKDCITYGNTSLAQIVVAYKGYQNTTLPAFIIERIGSRVPQRQYVNKASSSSNVSEESKIEDHIVAHYMKSVTQQQPRR